MIIMHKSYQLTGKFYFEVLNRTMCDQYHVDVVEGFIRVKNYRNPTLT